MRGRAARRRPEVPVIQRTSQSPRNQLDTPPDRLPIHLPSPGPFAGRIQPESSVPCAGPFDGDDWVFTVDWEGARCLLFSYPDVGIRLQGETLADVSDRFPEIVRAGSLEGGRPAVLDGVVCVLDPQGRPDLPGLARRVAVGPASAPRLPVVFLVTDLLHLDGAPTMRWSLERRLADVADLVPPDSHIQVPEHVVGQGRALAVAAAERGLSAVLARRRDSPYRPGVPSPERLRVNLGQRVDAVVVGARTGPRGAELLLAEHEDGRLRPAGTVEVTLEAEIARWFETVAEPVLESPLAQLRRGPGGVTWMRPRLVATVDHAGRDQSGALRRCRLVALRDDVDPQGCVRRAPLPAPSAGSAQRLPPFSPTVLAALPLGDAV